VSTTNSSKHPRKSKTEDIYSNIRHHDAIGPIDVFTKENVYSLFDDETKNELEETLVSGNIWNEEKAGHLEGHYASSEYFQTPRKFFMIMEDSEAIMLSYLINVSKFTFAIQKNNGWFYHTSKQIEEELYRNKNKQDRTIKQLVDLGFIEKKMEGMPCVRYFRICYEHVHESIEKARKHRKSLENPVAQTVSNRMHQTVSNRS